MERFRIDDLESLDADLRRRLPPDVRPKVLEWAARHRRELMENWIGAGRKQPPAPIAFP